MQALSQDFAGIFDYMTRLDRHASGIRFKARFDPLDVFAYWNRLLMIRLLPANGYIVTYAGGEVVKFAGREIVNLEMTPANFGDGAARFRALYDKAVSRPDGVAFEGDMAWRNKDHVHFQEVLWPLGDGDGRVTHLFGAIRHEVRRGYKPLEGFSELPMPS